MLLVVFLAITTLAAEHLYRLRRPRDILIKGRFLLPPGAPPQMLPSVDVILRYRRHRLRIDPSGRQRLKWRAPEVKKVWFDRPDGSTPYTFTWLKNGRYEVRLQPLARALPRRAQLLFRFPEGSQLLSRRFRLYRSDRRRLQATGWSFPMELKNMPAVKRHPAPRPGVPSASPPDFERPELDMVEGSASEDQEIRKRAESALQNINSLSTRTLNLRYRLIEYLESHPFYSRHPSTARTRKIGVLLKEIAIHKVRLVELLVQGRSEATPPSGEEETEDDDEQALELEEQALEPDEEDEPQSEAPDDEEEDVPLPGD